MQGVAVVGNGVVGSVVAGCFARLGHPVVGVESDRRKLALLQAGRAPLHEEGLEALLSCGIRAGRLRFTDDLAYALAHSSTVFLCVGSGGELPDLAGLDDHVVVVKSTLPIGTTRRLAEAFGAGRLVCNPEFLRQGSAIADFLHPERIVLGGDDPSALDAVAELYRPILEQTVPGRTPAPRPVVVRTSIAAAELIKHASNAFLALKVSFANEIANICAAAGVDVGAVTEAVGLDRRIGPAHLSAGVGWGGSCLGKDLAALIDAALEHGYDARLLSEVVALNHRQRQLAVEKLRGHLGGLEGRRICLLGLAFKPGTDDLRDAPALAIAAALLAAGATVTAYDPVVRRVPGWPDLILGANPYEAASGVDAVVLVTDWPEFAGLDFAAIRSGMRGNLFVDGRNAVDGAVLAEAGFFVESFGRRDSATAPVSTATSVVSTPSRSQPSLR
ncbi:MAG: UDP-glucose/GDP-mannose dehydrogenase family protein [Actinomycetota bacterium]|jgi:UDPglucose 6-dehydrogenase